MGEKTAAETQEAASPVERRSVDEDLVKQLTELWQRLLKIYPVSLDDDFFEKGGDSLLAMEMLTELEWRTGLTIPNSILFEATTIRQVAQVLSERRLPGPKAVVHVNASGTGRP